MKGSKPVDSGSLYDSQNQIDGRVNASCNVKACSSGRVDVLSGVQGNQTPVVYSQSDRAQGGRSRRTRGQEQEDEEEWKEGDGGREGWGAGGWGGERRAGRAGSRGGGPGGGHREAVVSTI